VNKAKEFLKTKGIFDNPSITDSLGLITTYCLEEILIEYEKYRYDEGYKDGYGDGVSKKAPRIDITF